MSSPKRLTEPPKQTMQTQHLPTQDSSKQATSTQRVLTQQSSKHDEESGQLLLSSREKELSECEGELLTLIQKYFSVGFELRSLSWRDYLRLLDEKMETTSQEVQKLAQARQNQDFLKETENELANLKDQLEHLQKLNKEQIVENKRIQTSLTEAEKRKETLEIQNEMLRVKLQAAKAGSGKKFKENEPGVEDQSLIKPLETRILVLSKELEELKNENLELKQTKEAFEEEIKAAKKTSVDSDSNTVTAEKDKLINQLKAKLEITNTNAMKAETLVSNLQANNKKINDENERLSNLLDELSDQNQKLKNEITKLAEENNQLRGSLSTLESQRIKEDLTKSLSSQAAVSEKEKIWTLELAKLKDELQAVHEEKERALTQQKQQSLMIEDLKKLNENLDAMAKQSSQNMETMNAHIQTIEQEYVGLQQQFTAYKEFKDEDEAAMKTLYERRIALLEEALKSKLASTEENEEKDTETDGDASAQEVEKLKESEVNELKVKFESEIAWLNDIIREKSDIIAELEDALASARKEQQILSAKISTLEMSLENTTEELERAEAQNGVLREQNNTTQAQVALENSSLKSRLQALEGSLQESQIQREKITTEMTRKLQAVERENVEVAQKLALKERELHEIKEEKEVLKRELKSKEDVRQTLQAEKDQLAKALKKKQEEHEYELDKRTKEKDSVIESINRKMISLQQELLDLQQRKEAERSKNQSSVNQMLDEKEKELAAAKKKLSEFEDAAHLRINQLESQVRDLEKKLKDEKTQNQELEKELHQSENAKAAIFDELFEIIQEKGLLDIIPQEKLENLKESSLIELTEAAFSKLLTTIQQLEDEQKAAQKELTAVNNKVTELEEKKKKLEAEIEKVSQVAKDATAKSAKFEQENMELNVKLNELKALLEAKESQIEALSKEKSTMAENYENTISQLKEEIRNSEPRLSQPSGDSEKQLENTINLKVHKQLIMKIDTPIHAVISVLNNDPQNYREDLRAITVEDSPDTSEQLILAKLRFLTDKIKLMMEATEQ